jgi:hypothetical protein
MVDFQKVNRFTTWDILENGADLVPIQGRTAPSSEQRAEIFRAILQNFSLERENQALIEKQNSLMRTCITSFHSILPHQSAQTFLLQKNRDSYLHLNAHIQELTSAYYLECQQQEHFNQETGEEIADLSQGFADIRQRNDSCQAIQSGQSHRLQVLKQDVEGVISQSLAQKNTLVQLRSDVAEIRIGFDAISGSSQPGGLKQIRDAVEVIRDTVEGLRDDLQVMEENVEDLNEVSQKQEKELQELMKDSKEKQLAVATLRKLMEEIESEEEDDLQDELASNEIPDASDQLFSLEPLARVPISKPLAPLFGWLFTNWSFFGCLTKVYQRYQIGVVSNNCWTDLAITFRSSSSR